MPRKGKHSEASAEQKSEIGFGRPPIHHRIKTGETRNPWGRRGKPKPKLDFLEDVIELRVEGKPTRLTRDEALDHFLFMNAAKGKVAAIKELEARRLRRAAAAQAGVKQTLTPEDEASLRRYLQRQAASPVASKDAGESGSVARENPKPKR